MAELGLIVLDDADDSNPYALIMRGPASGMVVHFSHDPEPALAFPDLATFLNALSAAVRDDRNIDHLERHRFSPLPNQPALRSTLQGLLESDDEDAPLLVAILFPLLDPDERDTVRLAGSALLLSHAGGRRALRRGPSRGALPRDSPVRLSEDSYTQVADPARRALQLIVRPGSPQ